MYVNLVPQPRWSKMVKKRYKMEEIIQHLRTLEIEQSCGASLDASAKKIGVAPQKQPKRRRLWLNDGSCIRLKPEFKNHVWSCDFVSDRTHNGRPYKMLNIIDEHSREALACLVQRRINSQDIIFTLAEFFLQRGGPQHIRSDSGPEFIAKRLNLWFEKLDVKPLFIALGSPWENALQHNTSAQ